MTSESNKDVISTYNSDVLSYHLRDLAKLAPCTHEQADTRIILHLEDTVKDGNDKLSIRTVDTETWDMRHLESVRRSYQSILFFDGKPRVHQRQYEENRPKYDMPKYVRSVVKVTM